jgi:hypothetical protein
MTDWREEWKGMPEFVQEDLSSFRKVVVHFRNQEDVDLFAELIGQKLTPKQPSCWYPHLPIMRVRGKFYVDEP